MAVEKRGKFWFLQLANGLHGKMARLYFTEAAWDLVRPACNRSYSLKLIDSLPQGMPGWQLVLWEWWPRGPEGTPSAKICPKLPLFPALAMTFRELKYAQSLHN